MYQMAQVDVAFGWKEEGTSGWTNLIVIINYKNVSLSCICKG